jgi:TonB-dependent starch-binding outer membrane protein SusC
MKLILDRKINVPRFQRFILLLFCVLGWNSIMAQTVNDPKVTLKVEDVTLDQLFKNLESTSGYSFRYSDDIMNDNREFSYDYSNTSLNTILTEISKDAGLEYKVGDNTVTIKLMEKKVLKGKVTDSLSGGPLVGATVAIKGTTQGTTTDVDGNYSIEVYPNSILNYSFIGYLTEEVNVEDRSTIDISLVNDVTSLSEIVVIGYGSINKSDLTGAVGSLREEDFNSGLFSSPEQLMQGKIAGVNITSSSGAPGSGQRIIIRGQGSIREGSGPLFVIDGFPIGLAGTGSNVSPLNFINIEDIESIDILKDASATAIYGSRGANGVILIKTKKGKAESTISFSSNFGISNISKTLPVFSANEFRDKVVEIGGILEDRGGNTDWQDELTRTAITQDQNLILSGGSDNLTYRASLGYLEQEGIVLNTGIERYSGRVNATQKLMNDRLNIDFTLYSTIETGKNAQMGTVVSNMLSFNPTYPAFDANGEPTRFQDLMNPLSQADLFKTFHESRKMIVNIAPSFEIVKGLVYKLNLGYENGFSETNNQDMPSVDPFVVGFLRQSFYEGKNTLVENYLTYTLGLDAHNITLLAGHSYQKTQNIWSSWTIAEFEANGIEPRFNPGLGQRLDLVENRPSGWATINELQSYFGRANYSYKGKYLLTGTLRIDGSSKFGKNNKYGTFPSFAAGWRISEESFMSSSPISNLKLRAGWGQTGNQEIPAKITQASYQSSNSGSFTYPMDQTGNYPVGTVYTRLANPDIQWELSTQTNIGIDFGFFSGALSGTVDYFHKVSNNILVEVASFDPVSPAPTYWTNVDGMTITNKGLEAALDYQYRRLNGFSFTVGANATFMDNVVENSPFTVLTTGSASGSGQTGATINGMINGYSIGSFYMPKFTGIGEDGLSTYAPAEKEGGDNRYVVGSALPDVLYNFYFTMEYKRFDLGVNVNGVSGNHIYNHTAMNKFYKGMLATSNNVIPESIKYPEEAITNAAIVSTRFLEDGSFLRLNNMTLGYNFNTRAWGNGNWIKELRLSITAQNLFVLTDYSGFDPEVNQDKSVGGIQSFGIDDNAYPKARTFIVGLNLTF